MVIPRVVVRLSFLTPRGPLSGQAMYIRALVNNVETHEIPIELTCYYLVLRTAKAPRKQCLDSGAHQVMGSGLLDCNCCRVRYHSQLSTVESRFLEPSVYRTSRYFEPILVSLGFASLKFNNFTPDFSKPRILETPESILAPLAPLGQLFIIQ